jgi:hypothetical protein
MVDSDRYLVMVTPASKRGFIKPLGSAVAADVAA